MIKMNFIYIPLIIFTAMILTYLTYQDIKYRAINILSLIILAFVSVVYLGFFIFKNNSFLWYNYLYQIIVSFLFLLIFFILGKVSSYAYIGEGDLYILMGLSFTNIFDIYFVMFIFLFSLGLTLLVPVGIFIYNLFLKNFPKYSFPNSLYLMFLGYPLKLKKINEFYTPLEKYFLKEGKLESKLTLRPNIEPKKELLSIKSVAKKNNIKMLWVSPLIPFAVFIFLSYILIVFLYFIGVIEKLLLFIF